MREQRGRQAELAALRAAFDAATARGALVVVRGEPGSGRTELLRQAAGVWRGEGVPVVSQRPRARSVVVLDDADALDAPVLTASSLRAPGCLVVATCVDAPELAEAADLVIDLPPLPDEVVIGLLTARAPLDDSVVHVLRTALGPLFGNPGTAIATLDSLDLTMVGDRLFLTSDRISLPTAHGLLEHLHGLARRVALLITVRGRIEVEDLALLGARVAECGRALDALVDAGVVTGDLRITCPALANAIIDLSGPDEVRALHVALATGTADPDLVALAGPDLADAPGRAGWLADRAAEIEDSDPERAGHWYVAAVRMSGAADPPCARLFRAAFGVLVRTGQDDLMTTLLAERMADDENTDAAAMLLLLNGMTPPQSDGPATALARWWLGDLPEWTPRPMNAADDAVIIGAELNAIYHALRVEARACKKALVFVRDEHALDRFDDLIESGAAGDVASVLEHVLGPRYRTPERGPLRVYQNIVRGFARADWTSALRAVRQLELVEPAMPAHHLARLYASAIHTARGEFRQAGNWLAEVSRETRYAPARSTVECGLMHRTGDSVGAVNLAWRTLERARLSEWRPGVERLMLQALQITLRNGDTAIAHVLMEEIEALHRRDDCRCTLQILLLARGLLHGDPREAARGAEVVRQRGHRPDLLWACHILAQFCDDPRPVVRELHTIAKEGGSSFLLPAKVSALMRKFGATAPRSIGVPGEYTDLELHIVELVRAGQTNRQIATELEIREKTVEYHLTRLFLRTGCRSRVELAAASLDGRLEAPGRGMAG